MVGSLHGIIKEILRNTANISGAWLIVGTKNKSLYTLNNIYLLKISWSFIGFLIRKIVE